LNLQQAFTLKLTLGILMIYLPPGCFAHSSHRGFREGQKIFEFSGRSVVKSFLAGFVLPVAVAPQFAAGMLS